MTNRAENPLPTPLNPLTQLIEGLRKRRLARIQRHEKSLKFYQTEEKLNPIKSVADLVKTLNTAVRNEIEVFFAIGGFWNQDKTDDSLSSVEVSPQEFLVWLREKTVGQNLYAGEFWNKHTSGRDISGQFAISFLETLARIYEIKKTDSTSWTMDGIVEIPGWLLKLDDLQILSDDYDRELVDGFIEVANNLSATVTYSLVDLAKQAKAMLPGGGNLSATINLQ